MAGDEESPQSVLDKRARRIYDVFLETPGLRVTRDEIRSTLGIPAGSAFNTAFTRARKLAAENGDNISFAIHEGGSPPHKPSTSWI